jgi:hypothetical protein
MSRRKTIDQPYSSTPSQEHVHRPCASTTQAHELQDIGVTEHRLAQDVGEQRGPGSWVA